MTSSTFISPPYGTYTRHRRARAIARYEVRTNETLVPRKFKNAWIRPGLTVPSNFMAMIRLTPTSSFVRMSTHAYGALEVVWFIS